MVGGGVNGVSERRADRSGSGFSGYSAVGEGGAPIVLGLFGSKDSRGWVDGNAREVGPDQL